MDRRDDTCIREFRDDDVASIAQLIHHTIDVCYTRVYVMAPVKPILPGVPVGNAVALIDLFMQQN